MSLVSFPGHTVTLKHLGMRPIHPNTTMSVMITPDVDPRLLFSFSHLQCRKRGGVNSNPKPKHNSCLCNIVLFPGSPPSSMEGEGKEGLPRFLTMASLSNITLPSGSLDLRERVELIVKHFWNKNWVTACMVTQFDSHVVFT